MNTFTQDFYYSTEAKPSYDTYYNFHIPIDVNIDVKKDEKLKFKLIDFSMMNSMLNISEAHKNNMFKFRDYCYNPSKTIYERVLFNIFYRLMWSY